LFTHTYVPLSSSSFTLVGRKLGKRTSGVASFNRLLCREIFRYFRFRWPSSYCHQAV